MWIERFGVYADMAGQTQGDRRWARLEDDQMAELMRFASKSQNLKIMSALIAEEYLVVDPPDRYALDYEALTSAVMTAVSRGTRNVLSARDSRVQAHTGAGTGADSAARSKLSESCNEREREISKTPVSATESQSNLSLPAKTEQRAPAAAPSDPIVPEGLPPREYIALCKTHGEEKVAAVWLRIEATLTEEVRDNPRRAVTYLRTAVINDGETPQAGQGRSQSGKEKRDKNTLSPEFDPKNFRIVPIGEKAVLKPTAAQEQEHHEHAARVRAMLGKSLEEAETDLAAILTDPPDTEPTPDLGHFAQTLGAMAAGKEPQHHDEDQTESLVSLDELNRAAKGP